MNRRLFDSQSVDRWSAKFTGTFDVDDDDIGSLGLDDQVVFVVVARVDGAAFKRTANGDLQRVNQLGVRGVRIAEGASREQLVRMFSLTDLQEKLPLDEGIDNLTGEVLVP